MKNLKEYVRDGGAKSEFNQQPAMLELLEDRNNTVRGLYQNWNHISQKYRENYDSIKWEK